MEREVAVEQPRSPGEPGDERNRKATRRPHREARAAARVDHPAAVSLHDAVEGDGPDGPEEPAGSRGSSWNRSAANPRSECSSEVPCRPPRRPGPVPRSPAPCAPRTPPASCAAR
ncbi:hypothetical protein GCM10015536_19110 [Streptomyces griseomycini]|nr:hypothetical protein GCM10015536_19110 [Streptomyces griseomycini]